MALTDSLISYWKLDEASGNALDAHGSNDLTDNNTVGSATGKISNARDFEFSNSEYFRRTDNADLSTGDIDFTIQAWVKTEAKTTYMFVLCKDGDTPQREYGLFFAPPEDRWSFFVSNNGTDVVLVRADNLGSPSNGVWYHIVCWHDSVNNEIGIAVNAGTPNTTSHTTGVKDSTSAVMMGCTYTTAGSYNAFMDGLIDEVGFWKRVLTSDERTALYNSGNGLAYPFASGVPVGTLMMMGMGR